MNQESLRCTLRVLDCGGKSARHRFRTLLQVDSAVEHRSKAAYAWQAFCLPVTAASSRVSDCAQGRAENPQARRLPYMLEALLPKLDKSRVPRHD